MKKKTIESPGKVVVDVIVVVEEEAVVTNTPMMIPTMIRENHPVETTIGIGNQSRLPPKENPLVAMMIHLRLLMKMKRKRNRPRL